MVIFSISFQDVDTEQAVGSILEDSQDDDEEDDVDDVLQGVNMGEDDVVAAAFGTSADSVQNAINSILDTLPQGDRIETPDINNITGLFDSIEGLRVELVTNLIKICFATVKVWVS